jgi:hypothetical protein
MSLRDYIVPLQENFAVVRPQLAADHIEDCGLARPIRTQEDEDFALSNAESSVIDGDRGVKAFRNTEQTNRIRFRRQNARFLILDLGPSRLSISLRIFLRKPSPSSRRDMTPLKPQK